MLQTMPETVVAPKRTSSLSPTNSFREESKELFVEKRITQCVSRKFERYSQLPIRCHRPSPYYLPPRTSFRLVGLASLNRTSPIDTAKSCPESSTRSQLMRMIGISGSKKSASMTDLSSPINELQRSDSRSDSSCTLEKLDNDDRMKKMSRNDLAICVGVKNWMDGFGSMECEERGSRFFHNPRKAAGLVCHVLMLNAWRRRRSEVLYLQHTIGALSQRIEHLHLQILVLRRLLDTENSRIGRVTEEVHRVKTQFDETVKERDALKLEKEKMEEEMKRFSELSAERLVTAENLRNDLSTAKNQLQALEKQISKDREKLLKLREDKKILLEKVTASETLATEREGRAEKAEAACEDLQMRLASHIALVESSQEKIQQYSKELQVKEAEKSKLQNRLKASEESGKSLSLRTVFLEAQLADKEEALLRMESAYNSQGMHLNELRERLIRQSQEGGWSSRMLQIAGTVVRAPGAILRTLLFTTGPVITP